MFGKIVDFEFVEANAQSADCAIARHHINYNFAGFDMQHYPRFLNRRGSLCRH